MTLRALVVAVLLLGTAGPALAQDAPAPPVRQREIGGDPRGFMPPRAEEPPAERALPAAKRAKTVAGDLQNSKGAAVLFWLFALTCVGGTIFVITRRNLVTATMGLVGTFLAIAAVYAMLYAHFMAVIQVLVYAGAIMVLFVFVVMILNREEDQPWGDMGWPGKILAGTALAYLLARLGQVLWRVRESAPADIVPVQVTPERVADWGSTRAMADTLFTDYLFPFEAVSLVLLIAVVGALAVARSRQRAEEG